MEVRKNNLSERRDWTQNVPKMVTAWQLRRFTVTTTSRLLRMHCCRTVGTMAAILTPETRH